MSERSTSGVTRREALRITAVGGLSLAMGGGLVHGLLRRAGLHRVTETRPRLGTLVTITSVQPEPQAARALVDAGFAEIERLEAVLNRHAPGTAITRLNERGRLDGAPGELLEVLERARLWHERTGGAFDPTVAPVLELWSRRTERGLPPPTDAEIAEALGRVGFAQVEVEGRRVRFVRPGVALTLDGIAKGYVVDRTVGRLVAEGAERVMVDAGGDIASGGPATPDDPWTIAVQDPHVPVGSLGRVRLSGDAVATSGDYMQAFTQDRRHHHILDPRTGRSPDRVSSSTVVAATAMDADALSTAMLVLGPEEAVALLDALPDAEGLIVAKDGSRWASRGMRLAHA